MMPILDPLFYCSIELGLPLKNFLDQPLMISLKVNFTSPKCFESYYCMRYQISFFLRHLKEMLSHLIGGGE